jgi:hypothetical protein
MIGVAAFATFYGTWGMSLSGRLQKLAISLKQPLDRQVSGKAAAQTQREERVKTCHQPYLNCPNN